MNGDTRNDKAKMIKDCFVTLSESFEKSLSNRIKIFSERSFERTESTNQRSCSHGKHSSLLLISLIH